MTATPKPDLSISFTREEGVVHIGGIDALDIFGKTEERRHDRPRLRACEGEEHRCGQALYEQRMKPSATRSRSAWWREQLRKSKP
jgi:hypothetical protein